MNKVLLALFLTTTFFSCTIYPDSDASLEDLDVVITYYDLAADYESYKTYVIVDSILEIGGDTSSSPIFGRVVDPEISDFTLDVIKTNMSALNYELVQDPADADLALSAGVIKTKVVSVTPGYPGYWYGCGIYWCSPGYWYGYPGYGYYYPYYPIPVVSSYDTGTLIIDMVDLENFDPANSDSLDVVWSGIVRGVLESSTSVLKRRINDGVDQAFEQSPYLGTN
jgi:hypothetical protein